MLSELSPGYQVESGADGPFSDSGGADPERGPGQGSASITDGPLLVGVDWSKGSQHALRWVSGLAQTLKTSVQLVHAISPWEGVEMSIPPFDYDEYRKKIRETVNTWGDVLSGIDHYSRVVEDNPVDALLIAAARIRPALIAIGAHPAGEWLPHSTMSVPSKLVHAADRPVAVVPESAPTTLGSIVVGVDGSPSSIRALRWAARSATAMGQTVHVVSAYPPDVHNPNRPHLADPGSETPIVDTAAALRDLAKQVSRETHAKVNSHLLIGDPAERLVTVAEHSAALVMGKNHHGAVAEVIFGSTSRMVTAHSKAPVIVVP